MGKTMYCDFGKQRKRSRRKIDITGLQKTGGKLLSFVITEDRADFLCAGMMTQIILPGMSVN